MENNASQTWKSKFKIGDMVELTEDVQSVLGENRYEGMVFKVGAVRWLPEAGKYLYELHNYDTELLLALQGEIKKRKHQRKGKNTTFPSYRFPIGKRRLGTVILTTKTDFYSWALSVKQKMKLIQSRPPY